MTTGSALHWGHRCCFEGLKRSHLSKMSYVWLDNPHNSVHTRKPGVKVVFNSHPIISKQLNGWVISWDEVTLSGCWAIEGGCPLVAEPEINERACQSHFSVVPQSRQEQKKMKIHQINIHQNMEGSDLTNYYLEMLCKISILSFNNGWKTEWITSWVEVNSLYTVSFITWGECTGWVLAEPGWGVAS